jgi:hypothetical protein
LKGQPANEKLVLAACAAITRLACDRAFGEWSQEKCREYERQEDQFERQQQHDELMDQLRRMEIQAFR